MKVQLRANEPIGKLAERLSHAGGPSAVTDLDLTNCFRVDAHEALLLIIECKQLRRLLCAASPITPSDVLKLVTLLPHLEEVQFSNLVYRSIVGLETVRLIQYSDLSRQHSSETATRLDTFKLTSELPSHILREPPDAFDFADYAAVCANFTYQKSMNFRSCVRLRDLVEADVQRRVMPFQTTLVAVDGHFTPDWFRVASIKHDWRNVRQLCLVLLPLCPVTFYPAVEGTYRECLRVLSTQLMLLVELNVSSFHFGSSLDVTAFLQDGSLHFLQSLSAPPLRFARRVGSAISGGTLPRLQGTGRSL
ncbi:hypothetical protein MTO96_037899 [Rhipicephalus appendiculatus]